MFRVLTASLTASILLTAGTAQAAPLYTWVVAPPVPTPKAAIHGMLRDVSVVSPNDVWVVGRWTGGGSRHTLAAQWDGTRWTRVPTPDSPGTSTEYLLNSVDAVASDNVWAVGGIQEVANPSKSTPLFLHYDGTAWTQAPAPSGVDGELSDIDLLTADEGWAVGTNQNLPFILRRTAGNWQSWPTPVLPGTASLQSVYATSPTDAWAVGSQESATRKAALVLHWDGLVWSEVAVPEPLSSDTALLNVAATSASDVWAVGSQCSFDFCLPWVLHLAGGTWRKEPTAPGAWLTSVVALAPDDVWIFGQTTTPFTAIDHIEHWDGTRFTPEPSLPPHTTNPHHPASAVSLAAAAGHRQTGGLWAVGWIEVNQKSNHAIYRN